MTRPVKFLLLFIALLLPGLIYVFLKGFGSNEFDVPALYQQEMTIVRGCEAYRYSIPYSVPDSVMSGMGLVRRTLSLVAFEPDGSLAGLGRITSEFKTDSLVILEVPDSLRSNAICALILQAPANAVVVDDALLIRGQYNLRDRKEVDRLVVELKILLKKY